MIDGRYKLQKDRMLLWSKKCQQTNVVPKMIYLVEGFARHFKIKCEHGCLSQCGWPTAEQLEASCRIVIEPEW